MKRLCWCLVALCAVLGTASPASAGFRIGGTLTGDQETAPSLSPAVGTFFGTLSVSGTTATLTFTVTFPDIPHDLIGGDIFDASFNLGAPGIDGPSLRDYSPGDFTFLNLAPTSFGATWSSTDAQPLTPILVSQLLSGNVYFNIATQEFTSPGEVRGPLQVVPEPSSLSLSLVGAAGLALAGFRRWRAARTMGGGC